MASEELVTEQFQFLGIEITREVLVKCEYFELSIVFLTL